jgi:sigma-E factor negative regulatory protein RseA
MANKEHISALVDGEIQDSALLEQLGNDRELSDTFGRYHLYGDALRNELPHHLQLDLSERVAAALADEPAIIAAPAPSAPKGEKAGVIRPLFGRVAPMLRHVGQFAVAASVSAAVIVGVQQYSQNDLQSPVLNTVPLSGGAAPVSLNYQFESPERSNEQTLLEQQRRIQELLVDHELQQRLHQN